MRGRKSSAGSTEQPIRCMASEYCVCVFVCECVRVCIECGWLVGECEHVFDIESYLNRNMPNSYMFRTNS
jgi:hypothetical protein